MLLYYFKTKNDSLNYSCYTFMKKKLFFHYKNETFLFVLDFERKEDVLVVKQYCVIFFI